VRRDGTSTDLCHCTTAPATTVSVELFCALRWEAEEKDNDQGDDIAPPHLLVAEALDLGTAAWEDGGSLKWPVTVALQSTVAGRVSIEVEVALPGPQPHTRELLVVFPLKPFDLDYNGTIGVAKGVFWWTPGTAPKITKVNRSATTQTANKDVQVAMAYATNCDDIERMLLLKEPPATCPRPEHWPRGPPPHQTGKNRPSTFMRPTRGS